MNLKWIENYVNYEDWIYLWNMAKGHISMVHDNRCAFLYRIHGPQSTVDNFRTSARDRQKLQCLVPLLLQYDRTFFYNCLAKGRIYQEIVTITSPDLKKEYQPIIEKSSFQLCGYLYKVIGKLDRIRGGGKWSRLYGATADNSVFKNYIKLIPSE